MIKIVDYQIIKFFLVAFVTTLLLQPYLFGINNNDRNFFSINEIHGLSQRTANSVIEDSNGFIWASSKTAIVRLTEDNSRTYLLPYVTPDAITIKLVYGANELTAYSNNGQFFRYNNVLDRFEFYFDLRPLLGTNRISVFNVLADSSGVLYIPTTLGLFTYGKSQQLVSLTEIYHEVRYIDWYNNNELFITKGNSIQIINTIGEQKNTFPITGFTRNIPVSKLFYDNEYRRLWIGTQPGHLLYLDIRDREIKVFENLQLPKQPILAIEAVSDSTIMLGFDGQGLWEINRAGTHVLNIYREDVNNPSSLRGNGVYDIFKDSNKRIWVCTYSGGVSFFEQSSADVRHIKHIINNHNSLVNNGVNDVFEDSEGNIWFATNNGISRWNITTNKWDSYLDNKAGESKVVLSIFGDSQGKIWAGTWASGVYVLDGKTGRRLDYYFYPGEPPPPLGANVFDTREDSQNDLWIVGVLEPVIRFDRKQRKIVRYNNEPVYVIKEFNENEMLLGCSFGLVLLNKHNGKQEIILDGYIIYDVFVINHVIWCATAGGGLIKLNTKDGSQQRFTIESGLPSNYVNSLYFADNFLWVGTENGLCRFCPEKYEVLNYSSIIQLANISFNPGAVHQLKNGQLIFGTNQGAVMLNPTTLTPREVNGRIFIQDIIIAGRTIRDSNVFQLQQPVDHLKNLNLTYQQRTISLELLLKGPSAAESKISWNFDALGNVWSTPSSNRVLTFANLPTGKFELKIRMYNNSLSQIIDERSLLVTISPPFWETRWFYTLMIFAIAAILYFVFRYQYSLIQKKHSEEKVEFFANTAHEIRTALTLIGGPIEEIKKETKLSERGKYYLTLATSQVNNLFKVSTQLLDFQKFDKGKERLKLEMADIVELIQLRINMFESLAERNKVKLYFNAEIESAFTYIDIDKMSQVFDNLISNAIKYSHQGGEVRMSFYDERNNWVFTVRDQGIGINPEGQKQLFNEFYRSDNAVSSKIMGSGIGLLMVRSYVENHNGRVSFSSEENLGSTFKIEVPYILELETKTDIIMPENDKQTQLIALLNDSEMVESEKINEINILIVEDNENLRGFMSVALGERFNVRTAVNGREAWEIINDELPDLVISDIMMPEMNGFDLCKLMKSTYETSHIAVILLTALTEKADQLQGIGLGADAYLTKPFDVTLLISRINSIIANRKAIKERALKLFDHETDKPILDNELNDHFVKKAFEVVKQNISNSEFSKDMFASEMFVSSSLLYKKIKSLTDQSPTDFIKSVRLKEAKELLKTRKYSITEVSELCGFASVGYFSTVFKKHYQKTPSEILEEQ